MKEKWIVEYIFNAFDIYSHRKKNLLNYAFLSNKKKVYCLPIQEVKRNPVMFMEVARGLKKRM